MDTYGADADCGHSALLPDTAGVYSADVPRRREPAPKAPSFRQRLWAEIEPAVRALLGDVALFMLLLAALTIAYLGLEGLGALGYRTERVELLETLHYWAYLAVFVMFLVDLVLKVFFYLVRKRHDVQVV